MFSPFLYWKFGPSWPLNLHGCGLRSRLTCPALHDPPATLPPCSSCPSPLPARTQGCGPRLRLTCPALRELSLSGCRLTSLAPQCPRLEALTLIQAQKLTDTQLRAALQQLPGLRRLHFEEALGSGVMFEDTLRMVRASGGCAKRGMSMLGALMGLRRLHSRQSNPCAPPSAPTCSPAAHCQLGWSTCPAAGHHAECSN